MVTAMKRTIAVVGFLLALLGCGAHRDEPPVIRWGEESCAHCRMLIGDPQFAAAIVMQDGEVRKYDDVGCLLNDGAKRQANVHRLWVRRYDADGWLDARKAWFVVSQKIASPMGYGIAAFARKEDAERLAKQVGGIALRWDDLLKRTPIKPTQRRWTQ
jgi:copper chaperone NosL